MKVFFCHISFITFCVTLFTYLSIKQNLNYVWFLGPHTSGKLILRITLLSVKQNLSHV